MRKKTQEEAEQEIAEVYGDEYCLNSTYISLHKNVSIKHKKCGRVEERKFVNLKNGKFKCPSCYGGQRTNISTEEFKEDVFKLVCDEYNVLGEYTTSKTPLKMFHNTCGNTLDIVPGNFMQGRRCNICSGLNFQTTDVIQDRVDEVVGGEVFTVNRKTRSSIIEITHEACGYSFKEDFRNFLINTACPSCGTGKFVDEDAYMYAFNLKFGENEYEVSGEYLNTTSPLTFKHNRCGYQNMVGANFFLDSVGCRKCYGKVLSKSTSYFQDEIREKFNGDFVVLGDYVDSRTPIKYLHVRCGTVLNSTPRSILDGRCHKCNGGISHTHDQFCQKLYKQVGDEYIVIGKYINNHTNLEIKHVLCGHISNNSPSNYLAGNRCSYCNDSKGEKEISNLLDRWGLNYIPQMTFEDCVRVNKLRFDFGVVNAKGEFLFLIEYDGIQHFVPSFGEESFKATVESDEIKNQYCIKNSISIIRIPYWEFNNIGHILFDKLVKHNLLEEIV